MRRSIQRLVKSSGKKYSTVHIFSFQNGWKLKKLRIENLFVYNPLIKTRFSVYFLWNGSGLDHCPIEELGFGRSRFSNVPWKLANQLSSMNQHTFKSRRQTHLKISHFKTPCLSSKIYQNKSLLGWANIRHIFNIRIMNIFDLLFEYSNIIRSNILCLILLHKNLL
jgi:hypothetical protein